MRATEFILEAKLSIRDQILADVKKDGGKLSDYFVRFSDVDKLGYSARQSFGRTPDMDDPKFDVEYIGKVGKERGHPALWFYKLKYWLNTPTAYAAHLPYVWLVKLKPNAWLQDATRFSRGIKDAPPGKERVGFVRHSISPAVIFFKPGFTVVGKYYDYGSKHKRHGQVKGAPKVSFFDKVRGYND